MLGSFFKKKRKRKKTLLLHIGTHKTGTTYLQDFLLKNKKALLKEGVLYPTTKYHPYGQQRLAYAFQDAVNPHLDGLIKNDPESVFHELKRLLSEVEHNYLLISSENITPKSRIEVVEKIQRFFSEYDVKVIVYLRRQDKYLVSLYREHVKLPNSEVCRFEDFSCPYPLDYNELVKPWETIFGEENVLVRSYDELLYKEIDIIKDFFQEVGVEINLDNYPTTLTKANTTLPNIALEMIRGGNYYPLSHQVRGRFNIAIRNFCKSYEYNDVWDLNKSNSSILSDYHESNSILFRKYFDGKDVFRSRVGTRQQKVDYDLEKILLEYKKYCGDIGVDIAPEFSGHFKTMLNKCEIQ